MSAMTRSIRRTNETIDYNNIITNILKLKVMICARNRPKMIGVSRPTDNSTKVIFKRLGSRCIVNILIAFYSKLFLTFLRTCVSQKYLKINLSVSHI